MRIVICNWRDVDHPKAGGAEVATHQLAEGLSRRGHSVTWFTSRHPGAAREEMRAGYHVVRRGSEVTCRLHAFQWLRNLSLAPDVVVDEVNTLPFLSRFATAAPVVVWMHQLAREVWLAEAPPVIGHIGYITEKLMLSIYKRRPVVTISQSSGRSMREIGLQGDIKVAEIALEQPGDFGKPVPGRVGYVGRLAPSKRVDHIVEAVAIAKKRAPEIELYVVGGGPSVERDRLERRARDLGIKDCVKFTGRVSRSERDDIVASLDVLAMASLREGWGLVVSEAARFGVPSVVYPVHGLVDSVQHEESGLVVKTQSPQALADGLLRVVQNRALRNSYGVAAREYLRRFTLDHYIETWEATLKAVVEQHNGSG